MFRILALLLAVMLAPFLTPRLAAAHSASSSYLRLNASGKDVQVQWSIALRDLDYAVGLDSDGDGDITWGELHARQNAVVAYALGHLRLSADGTACPAGEVTLLADQLGDGAYAVLRFVAHCPAVPSALGVHYTLMFDLDPLHRGLLSVISGAVVHAEALSPEHEDAVVTVTQGYGETISTFFMAGVEHLLSGIDHLLFVTMLLVPAMFYRRDGRLLPRPGFWGGFLETIKILSVFTVAHGTTLTLSVLHIISIPQRLSESGIALTIVLTAVDNIYPFLPGKRWMFAFAFGLIHGLGFANALGPLELPPVALAAALLSFNLGLDAAQIGIAAIVLPIGFAMRHTTLYPRLILPGVSAAAAVLALAWFTDRIAGLGMMPF